MVLSVSCAKLFINCKLLSGARQGTVGIRAGGFCFTWAFSEPRKQTNSGPHQPPEMEKNTPRMESPREVPQAREWIAWKASSPVTTAMERPPFSPINPHVNRPCQWSRCSRCLHCSFPCRRVAGYRNHQGSRINVADSTYPTRRGGQNRTVSPHFEIYLAFTAGCLEAQIFYLFFSILIDKPGALPPPFFHDE